MRSPNSPAAESPTAPAEAPARRPSAAAPTRAGDARHAAVGGATNLLNVLGALALPVFHTLVARIYGAASYGLYSVAVGLTEIFGRLGAVGTDKGLLRHIPSHRIADELELERRSLSTSFWLTAASATLLALAVYGLAGPLAALQQKPNIALAIRLLAPSTPFTALVLTLIAATMGAKVLRYNLLVRGIAQPLLLIAIALPVGLLQPTLRALCLSHLAAMVLVTLLAGLAVTRVFRHFRLRELLALGPIHWELARFSFPIGLSEFFNALLHRAALIIVGLYVSNTQLGVYAAVEMLSRAIASARNAFDPVVSPVLAEALRQQDQGRIQYNLQLMTRWVALLTFPLIALFLGLRRELLSLFGPTFVAGSTAFIVLNLGYLANGVLGLVGWVLAMGGRSRLVLANNLIAASANVLLCFLLAPRFGIVGAATATASALLLIQLLLLVQVKQLYGVHPFGAGLLRVTGVGTVTVVAAVVALPRLPGAPLLRMLVGALLIVGVYLGLLLSCALEPADRELLARLRRRLRRRPRD
ncbi:MAG: oligosaccharide flippase family protein [Proteobacteria bacterium]|nr:oligosaccharide flippase family protein [Pseudomonadota bacterium]